MKDFTPWRAFQSVFGMAFIVATLFTLWTPSKIFSNATLNDFMLSMQSETAEPDAQPPVSAGPMPAIGIVAGHWGSDSGAVCPDGLTELDINLRVATLVKQALIKEGYQVELLQEFDDKLKQYEALALISIHADSCDYINEEATGFKVAPAMSLPNEDKSMRLTNCLVDRYQRVTGLEFRFNTITPDMTQYHAFEEINSSTPAAIMETGFMNLDREILTKHPEIISEGIVQGILCFVRNEPTKLQDPPPAE